MEYFENVDTKLAGTFLIVFISSFVLGRYTKRTVSNRNYNSTLASLNNKIYTAGQKRSQYLLYNNRLNNICKIIVLIYCIIGYLMITSEIEIFNYTNSLLAAFFFIASVYATGFFFNWLAKDYQQREEMYKIQITTNKSQIINELGPEVMEILQGSECNNKKCKENEQKLSKNLKKHQDLIQKLSNFQWCNACSQGKKCTGICGSDFWNFIKEAYREFKE